MTSIVSWAPISMYDIGMLRWFPSNECDMRRGLRFEA
jgi:hypothetical protein